MVVIAAGDAYGSIDLQRNVPMCSGSGSDSRVAYGTIRPTSKFAKFNIRWRNGFAPGTGPASVWTDSVSRIWMGGI